VLTDKKALMTARDLQIALSLSTKGGYMPQAPRPKGKAKKIAYDVMGVPANMMHEKSRKRKKENERLVFEETQRSR
jgi:hypothetical protein